MPRQAKPYYRKIQKRWVCTIDGKRITLDADREKAHRKFHELMLDRENLAASVHTLYGLSQIYLDWVEKNRAVGTYNNQLRILKSFIAHTGRTMKVGALKNHHLLKWADAQSDWTSTSKNDAISTVLRMLNWAAEQGHIQRSPISKIKKPKRLRREIYYTPAQWKQICSHVKDGFIDLLDFMWSTGCRPKEARDLEARHVHLDSSVCLMRSDESKKEKPRAIFLTEETKEILKRLIEKYPTGKLFKNRRGNPWTKDSVKCRLTRISKKVGFRVIAYGTRHSYATEGLTNGVDSIVLAQLMGHSNTNMIANVYSHLSRNPQFLLEQATRVKSSASEANDNPPESADQLAGG